MGEKSQLNQKPLYNDTIPQNSKMSSVDLFSDDTKYSLSNSEVDKTYLDAVKNGDTETAQKMVDEVAKNAGYTIKSYHGTLDKNFTEFNKDFIGSRFSLNDTPFLVYHSTKYKKNRAASG